jgi:PAS domain S-box-containing protein
MKQMEKQSNKSKSTTMEKNVSPKSDKQSVEKVEDVQRLVHLLQIHQIELEHQNQELRIAQEELEVSRNKYVNLFDFSPIPYFTINADGIIKEVNLSASKMFGVDRARLIGNRFLSYIPLSEKEVFASFVKNIFSTNTKQTCELKVINKSKTLFDVLLEGLVIDDTLETDPKCQIALIDLTDYKKVEYSLKETNEELKILNTTKDKFFSIIAHDLRSPFQSLLGSTELLAKEIESLSKEEIAILGKGLNDNLKNVYYLIENLLYWSMMQRNTIEYKPVNINLFDLVHKVVDILKLSATKKNILISCNIGNGTFVFADLNMLRLVLHNLIMNAIKFTEPGGLVIVSSKSKGSFVEVSIQDSGVGIESYKFSELFDINTITTTEGTDGENGTGLGLPLCKEFVERWGGKIWVESELGKGSKFTFSLNNKNL